MKSLKVYVAGKIAKESGFGSHHWREEFCQKLQSSSGLGLVSLDPLSGDSSAQGYEEIFRKDCKLIKQCDVFVVYLSDDISVGGSQEILIAKYLKKPVIGYAPYSGKFNMATREMFGKKVTDYKDPFVFSTCDVVCGTIEEVADSLNNLSKLEVKDITLIDDAIRG